MLALVYVGAFTGRGHAYLCGTNPNPLIPSFRRPEPDLDNWDHVVSKILLYVSPGDTTEGPRQYSKLETMYSSPSNSALLQQ